MCGLLYYYYYYYYFIIIIIIINGFPVTQRQMTLKGICEYIILENFIGHVGLCRMLSYS